MSGKKSKLTTSVDKYLLRLAKEKGINLSETVEEGIKLKLAMEEGKPYKLRDKQSSLLQRYYREYFKYRIGLMNEGRDYRSDFGLNWVMERAIELGASPEELIKAYEKAFKEEMKRREEQKKLFVSDEETIRILESHKKVFNTIKEEFEKKDGLLENREPIDRFDQKVRRWAKYRYGFPINTIMTFNEFVSFLLDEREVVEEKAVVPYKK